MTVKEFLKSYAGNVRPVDLYTWDTEDTLETTVDDDVLYNGAWANAVIEDWEIVNGRIWMNVFKEC